jgi:hypothetical protein
MTTKQYIRYLEWVVSMDVHTPKSKRPAPYVQKAKKILATLKDV